jgi:hypothetical protein
MKRGLDIDVTGEGAEELPRNEKNLLVKAMYKGFDYLGGTSKRYLQCVQLECDSTRSWPWFIGCCNYWWISHLLAHLYLTEATNA